MWWIHTYQWLELNNLWKASVAFGVTVILGAVLSVFLRPWRVWRQHKRTQELIADRLDSKTPGGITDLIDALSAMAHATDQDEDGLDADDNGTDMPAHGGKGYTELPGGRGGIVPDAIHDAVHGGGSASHR